ncbi:MAG TPA: hypothetical protein VFV50_16865, partial [Bdellovibrionales bacterium]|nr:hypothetical protein [Bdellovibrionales bacterium]
QKLYSDRFLSFTLSTQLMFDRDNWIIELTPRVQQQWVDLQPYLMKPGAFLRVHKRFEHSETGFTYDYVRNAPQMTGIEYLGGPIHSAAIFYSWYTPAVLWSFSLVYDREDIGQIDNGGNTLPLAFDGFGPMIRALWYPTDAWELLSQAYYTKRKYTPLAQPGEVERADDQTGLSARVSYRLTKDVSFYLLGDFTSNKSTLDAASGKNKNYTQWGVFGGTTWELSL